MYTGKNAETSFPEIFLPNRSIQQAAKGRGPVLITGPAGTGKGLVARLIHGLSPQSSKPFVNINCTELAPEISTKQMLHLLEPAKGGIIFFDELSALSIPAQDKLLSFIKMRSVKFRLIMSTRYELKKLVKAGKLRPVLRRYLSRKKVILTGLSQRRSEIIPVFEKILKKTAEKLHRPDFKLSAGARKALQDYSWPWNIREMKHLAETLAMNVADGKVIEPEDLPPVVLLDCVELKNRMVSLKDLRHNFERQILARLMNRIKWNQSRASRILNVHRNTLILKMKELELK